MDLKAKLQKLKRKRITRFLQTTSPEYIENLSEKKLISEFHKNYKFSPAYADILKKCDLKPQAIKSVDEFKLKVPVLKKSNYFERYTFDQLLGKNISKTKLITSSSGFSGNFAFGFASDRAVRGSRSGADLTLDYWFNISNRKTFLINCAPMGVHVETSLALAETSVRSDMALSLIKKISPSFDQTIIAGDPHFLKKLVEEGTQLKIKWKELGISLISGQDWLPESLRTYLSQLLKIDIDNDESRAIYATMGMTELGLNVFHESKFTVRLRRMALNNPNLREKLSVLEMNASPMFFHYYPFSTYIESLKTEEGKELLFSILDKNNLLPIFRYSTGDSGHIISYMDLYEILKIDYPLLMPDLKLPMGILFGRIKNRYDTKGNIIFQEDIKEGLYNDFEVAENITGLIQVKNEDYKISVKVQLQKDRTAGKNLEKKIQSAVHTYLSSEVDVRPMNYFDFPEGTELNYERKLYFR
jgi:phenylacetate-CoA ligase